MINKFANGPPAVGYFLPVRDTEKLTQIIPTSYM